jgi:glycine C-acetyltransferase
MDGDLAPLPQLIEIAKKYGAVLIIDDAHGTGVLGEHGGGTCEHFHREKDIEVSMGTFSKSFGMNGGFVSSTKEIINYSAIMLSLMFFLRLFPPWCSQPSSQDLK